MLVRIKSTDKTTGHLLYTMYYQIQRILEQSGVKSNDSNRRICYDRSLNQQVIPLRRQSFCLHRTKNMSEEERYTGSCTGLYLSGSNSRCVSSLFVPPIYGQQLTNWRQCTKNNVMRLSNQSGKTFCGQNRATTQLRNHLSMVMLQRKREQALRACL